MTFSGFSEGTVETDRGLLFHRRGGEGPPVLLLHGFPETHLMWRDVAPVLARNHPLPDARRLLELLDGRGHRLVLASSGKRDEVDHYLDLLDARELVEAWTTSADVTQTKPDPDLVHTAVDKVGGGRAVMVVGKNLGGDSLQAWLTDQGYPTTRLGSAKGFRVLESRRL